MTKKFKEFPKEKVSAKSSIHVNKISKENLRLQARPENPLRDRKIMFAFDFLDREHELFNLGKVTVSWFLDLIDCLKEISKHNILELQGYSKFQLHKVNWDTANTCCPILYQEQDFWQFRINKSKGRIIGFLVDNIFYIVWLDYHHNLTSIEGYGDTARYSYPMSDYELLALENQQLKEEIRDLKDIILN